MRYCEVRATGPDEYQARCTCGWEGQPREYHTIAMQDALNHVGDERTALVTNHRLKEAWQ